MSVKTRAHSLCSRCGERHHNWAYCKDGERRVKAAPVFRKGDPLRGVAKRKVEAKKAREAVAVPLTDSALTVVAGDPTPAETRSPGGPEAARQELRDLAASLPQESQQRKALELLLTRDEAREGHAQAERELRQADPNAHLPLPTILRDLSEEKGRYLEMEMDRLLFSAGSTRASQREALSREARSVHDTLTGLEERRDEAAAAVREAAKPPEHVPGSQKWICHACNGRFNSGTMEYIRAKAKAEPTWRFVSPCCGSPKVEILERAAVA